MNILTLFYYTFNASLKCSRLWIRAAIIPSGLSKFVYATNGSDTIAPTVTKTKINFEE